MLIHSMLIGVVMQWFRERKLRDRERKEVLIEWTLILNKGNGTRGKYKNIYRQESISG